MSAEKKLQDAGVDMQEVLERLMGSEALLKRVFGKFLADDNMVKLKGALARNAIEEATLASHTLKGVCANLSMHRLQQLFSDQVEALRRGDEASAQKQMSAIETEYKAVSEAIQEYLHE